jgi:hypothetical protein
VITVLAVIGGVGILSLAVAAVLFMFGTPPRTERVRIELEAQKAAWHIQQQTRAAVQQLLDEARR